MRSFVKHLLNSYLFNNCSWLISWLLNSWLKAHGQDAMICTCMGSQSAGRGRSPSPQNKNGFVLVSFGCRFGTASSICLGMLFGFQRRTWSQVVGASFASVFIRILLPHLFEYASASPFGHELDVWSSEILVLLWFSFGFWCLDMEHIGVTIACGLSWCWNGVPINGVPTNMVSIAHIHTCWRSTNLIWFGYDISGKIRVPQEGGWCRGGSRNIVGWGNVSIANKNTNSEFRIFKFVVGLSKFSNCQTFDRIH